jgi:integrase
VIDFRAAAEDYLAIRRAMGYKLFYQGQMLAQFVAYVDGVGAEHLTINDAVTWAKQPAHAKRSWWTVRLSTVRGFARYLSTLDSDTEIPPAGLIGAPRSHRIVPYIYSTEDVTKLLAAAGRLTTAHRADTYQTLIGLVAVTGMRAGETVRLDRDDVDLEQGLLTIRDSKYGKSRQVPVHPGATDDEIATGRPVRASSSPPRAPDCYATTSAQYSRVWCATQAWPTQPQAVLRGCTI